ncbi:T-complex protein 1 subunit theta-like 2 [Octodon degus]|uniref:T-complex protein 1 subunit theta-like 2 n=1 Tax=Octodon degus TaxID=10160 RepID=A0A6P3F479_OCTDE|nr:T-complex protein 1 subunit theta-like 2 [Octodon degus]
MGSTTPPDLELPQRLGPRPKKTPKSPREEQLHLLSSLAPVQTLARIIQPCYGPHQRQKFLVTAQGDIVCTGSAAAILRALQLEHPAARLVREAAQAQAESIGDGAAFVVLLAEALLEQAELLLRAGLARTQLREAYSTALAEVLATLPSLAIRALGPLEDPSWALCSVMNTHSLAHSDYLAKLVASACWTSKEPGGSFKPERIGVCALHGGTLWDSCLLPGLVTAMRPCGQVTAVLSGARVALFLCPFGPARPSAPATACLCSLEDFLMSKRESSGLIEKQVGQLADADISVAVVWGDVDAEALALADQRGIMVIRAESRREIVYLSEVLSTPLLTSLLPPLKPGRCQGVHLLKLGDREAMVFEWEHAGAPVLTVVLRGATAEVLRGAEEAVYQGIDTYAQLCEDPRLLPGAGSTEMALARVLSEKGGKLAGPEGPAFLAFARALRSLPKALAENAGLAVPHMMAEMSGTHEAGNFLVGVGSEGILNVDQEGVWDPLTAKAQGLRAAVEVVLTLLTVDEFVLAKANPRPQQTSNPDFVKPTGSLPPPARHRVSSDCKTRTTQARSEFPRSAWSLLRGLLAVPPPCPRRFEASGLVWAPGRCEGPGSGSVAQPSGGYVGLLYPASAGAPRPGPDRGRDVAGAEEAAGEGRLAAAFLGRD